MGENLHVCIYERCGKSFNAPVRLTDLSHRPRSETYYACPYCFSKMDESEHESHSREAKLMKADGHETATSSSPKKQTTPESTAFECPYQMGYLKKRSKDESVPDSCLTCPRILQCMV